MIYPADSSSASTTSARQRCRSLPTSVLPPLVGSAISLAVIPLPDGRPWDAFSAAELSRTVGSGSFELLLHGCTHRRETRTISPLSWLTRHSDEFAALSLHDVSRRLSEGTRALETLCGRPPVGFVPPAWCAGRATELFASVPQLQMNVGIASLVGQTGPRVRLASWSWDAGRIASLGLLLEGFGHLLCRRVGSIPVVVIHPADVARGYFARALRLIRRLLQERRRPSTFAELIGATPA